MGSMIQAKCVCGYSSKSIFQGSGMIETIKDMEPAYCKKCRKLIVLNYNEVKPRCSKCHSEVKFYNDPALQNSSANQTKENHNIQRGDFFLIEGDYLCPHCGEMKMKFYDVVNWD